jgi:hypothetical protein
VTADGCCDGSTLKYCLLGSVITVDCATSPSCGWDSSSGEYDCGTAGGSAPNGTPKQCCVPQCDGRACGDDGCGGLCGTCAFNEVCDPTAGQCYPEADGCKLVPPEGCCLGNWLYYCDRDSVLVSTDCFPNPSCGWTGAVYDCGTAGAAGPASFPMDCTALTPPSDGGAP